MKFDKVEIVNKWYWFVFCFKNHFMTKCSDCSKLDYFFWLPIYKIGGHKNCLPF